MPPRILIIAFFAITVMVVPAQERKAPPFARGKDDPRHLPGFYRGGYRFKVDPYIEVAVALQKLGKEKAIQALKDGKLGDKEFGGDGLFILCRMLFVSKKDGQFRRPAIGGAHFLVLGLQSALDGWPLEPITLVDGVPFCIVRGYSLGGKAEQPSEYLQYCVENCEWSNYRFGARSKVEKQTALEKLVASSLLRGLRGEDDNFLKAQIE